jgi:hypothetical protein
MSKTPSTPTGEAPVTTAVPLLPETLLEFFCRRPLLAGEDPDEYDELLIQFSIAVQPVDVSDWFTCKDIVDLNWEMQRLSLRRAYVIDGARRRALETTLTQCWASLGMKDYVGHAHTYSHDWLHGDAEIRAEVLERLSACGLGEEVVEERALLDCIDRLEQIDRMLHSLARRRDAIYREFDRRRDSFARRVRAARSDITDIGPDGSPLPAKAL